mmetsp:Transcript_77783/g.220450  ORF Transcript_77783/g.220450 Transcript_77783/m.220450 type:complete len:230 (-) Transcript_77783:134-823(-)
MLKKDGAVRLDLVRAERDPPSDALEVRGAEQLLNHTVRLFRSLLDALEGIVVHVKDLVQHLRIHADRVCDRGGLRRKHVRPWVSRLTLFPLVAKVPCGHVVGTGKPLVSIGSPEENVGGYVTCDHLRHLLRGAIMEVWVIEPPFWLIPPKYHKDCVDQASFVELTHRDSTPFLIHRQQHHAGRVVRHGLSGVSRSRCRVLHHLVAVEAGHLASQVVPVQLDAPLLGFLQ